MSVAGAISNQNHMKEWQKWNMDHYYIRKSQTMYFERLKCQKAWHLAGHVLLDHPELQDLGAQYPDTSAVAAQLLERLAQMEAKCRERVCSRSIMGGGKYCAWFASRPRAVAGGRWGVSSGAAYGGIAPLCWNMYLQKVWLSEGKGAVNICDNTSRWSNTQRDRNWCAGVKNNKSISSLDHVLL